MTGHGATSPTRCCLILIAVVGVLGWAASYLWTGAPTGLVLASIVLPLVGGVLSPANAIAVTLTIAPLIDGIIAICSGRPLSIHNPYGLCWVEPLSLGALAGLLLRLLVTGRHSATLTLRLPFYVTVVVCAHALVLVPYLVHWRLDSWHLLRMMWRSLPYADQSAFDHSLRATALLVIAAMWVGLVRASVQRRDCAARAWIGWLAASLVVAGYGTWMWVLGEGSAAPRVESLLDDLNSYGSYLVLTFFSAWAVLRAEEVRWKGLLAAVALVASAWMLLLSGSRIAILAALAAAGAIWLVRIRRRTRSIAAVALVVAIVGSSWYWYEARSVQNPSLADLLKEVTHPAFLVHHFRETRQTLWSAAMRAFAEHPLLGVGPGLLYQDIGQYYRGDDRGWRPFHENAHNYFLQLAAETGVLGVIAWGWLVWAGLRPGLAAWRQGSGSFVLAVGGLAYLVTSLTGHPLMLSRQVVLFWGFVGLIPASFTHESPATTRNHTRVGSLGAAVVAATCVVIVLWRGGGIDCPRNVVSAAFTVGFYPREVSSSELPLVVEGDAPGEELRVRPEGSEGWRWMREAGELTLCNGTGRPVIVDLAVDIASFNEVRRVEIHERGTRL
ncbi:MAG TPA: O-antigen ligase family protein, partial [Candidatus Methylomirabilis sp.]|nr:O-antigen ligase family protein [Candidatus Methylomirabilis sp.]